MTHFISGTELPLSTLQTIVDNALAYKKEGVLPSLSGKILTLIFANPSLRTRLSFESGMKKLGGFVNVINGSDTWQFEYRDGVVMNENKQEHIKEAARVISQYGDVIGLRNSELITTHERSECASDTTWQKLRQDEPIRALAHYATRPVINMESNMFHPCQGLADVMTMQEKMGVVRGKKVVLTWAPHPKPLPLATPHSQMLMPAQFGANVVIACPPGFELDDEVVADARSRTQQLGGSLTVSNNQSEAFADADVIIAKSWASLKYFGQWEAEKVYRAQFADWTVTVEKMALTNNALFMHCLPVRRNVVVSDEVLDSPRSVIIDQAANRMWAQMALLNELLTTSL